MEYILTVFDNDENRDLKYLKWESQKVMDCLLDKQISGQLNHTNLSNVGLNDLVRTIQKLKNELSWFHFSGHHNQGKIRLEDSKFSNLVENLKLCKNLKVVFINGCTSIELIKDLAKFVPICIGTNENVYDCIAAEFSYKFYQAVFNSPNSKPWRDYSNIHDLFDVVLGNLKDGWDNNIENELKERLRACGEKRGGSLNGRSQNMYFISERIPSRKNYFNEKNTIISPDREKLFKVIKKHSNCKRPREYHDLVPIFFQEQIENLIKSPHLQQFGYERFKIIRDYYLAYFNFIRCTVLSLLFDVIFKLKIKNINDDNIFKVECENYFFTKDFNVSNAIRNLFDSIEIYSIEQIDEFFELLKLINTKSSDELKHLLDSFTKSSFFLKNYIELFKDESNTNETTFRNSEMALMKLLEYSSHINRYYIKSIHSRVYVKNRTDPHYVYRVDTGKKSGNIQEKEERQPTAGLENIYSVYLRSNDEKLSLNLTPFCIDCSSVNLQSSSIDVYSFSEENNGVFKYKSIDGKFKLKIIKRDNYRCTNDSIKTTKLEEETSSYEQLRWFIDTLKIWNENLFTNIAHR